MSGRADGQDLDAYGFSSYVGFNGSLTRWRYEALGKYFTGRSCLELGSSDGRGTEVLLPRFDRLVGVDGSAEAVRSLRSRLASEGATYIEAHFEDLRLDEVFDTVVLAHVLEHVADPAEVLAIAMAHTAPRGRLIIDVPNALSVHRRLGVEMGLLGAVTDLNESDLSVGHRRVYTPETFHAEVRAAGLEIEHSGGFMVKPLSNAQMERLFDEDLSHALFLLGEDHPHLAAEIYVVATVPGPRPAAAAR